MPTASTSIRTRLRNIIRGSEIARVRRRRAISAFISRWLPLFRAALLVTGYAWIFILASPRLGRGTYIDENALQPGQVTTYWNWADVHRADGHLAHLEHLRDINASSAERAEFLRIEFEKMGLSAATQRYSFSTAHEAVAGTNAYSVLSAPRASGAEAMVISASWLSRTGEGDGTLNLRGVATVLALAGFLKHYSLWAKDIVFVVSDGYLDGMHAWLSEYHGAIQSNLDTEHLALASGVIWTALSIDYPGHSFSHLGVFFEGLDGRLPNQDLFNSFQIISRHTGGVPVMLYDHLDPREDSDRSEKAHTPKWLPSFISGNAEVQEYTFRAKNIARHVGYQALGKASGVHGLFHRYRIDAITLFAVPAVGPHGFHAIGRVIESTLRTMNNLLERLHASFFFYILTTPGTFLKIGSYLPSAILISVALMFGGLSEWVKSGWIEVVYLVAARSTEDKPLTPLEKKWERRNRPVLNALLVMLMTHMAGMFIFIAVANGWGPHTVYLPFLPKSSMMNTAVHVIINFFLFHTAFRACYSTLAPAGELNQVRSPSSAPLSMVLKAMNICFTSTVISVASVLNFSLAAMIAVSLGLPLYISSPDGSRTIKEAKCSVYLLFTVGSLSFFVTERMEVIRNWEFFGVWFAPFICLIYVPLVLQAALVCSLPM